MPTIAQTFARMAGKPYADTAPDCDLIARFHQERDESAFAALVAKHGPMVIGVCQRKLRDSHAADDAFQATFLILARKAGTVAWQESLGGWLYRVAEHVCRKALGRQSRRTAPLQPDVHPAPPEPPPSELSAILDEELLRLPASYRNPIVLCHLEGQTVDEAARALGVSEGQLRGRLHRGREKLRARLASRGVTLSITAMAIALSAASAAALDPARIGPLATQAVGTLSGAWPATVSESVLSLTQLGMSAMSRLKTQLCALAAALVITVAGIGFGVHAAQVDRAASPVSPPVVRPQALPPQLTKALQAQDDDKKKDEEKIDRREGIIKSIDATTNKLVITTDEDKFDLTVELTEKSEVTVARRPVKLGVLVAGMQATASFRGTEKTAFKLEAGWPILETPVKAVDATKNTLTIKTEGNNGFEFDVVLPVATDALIQVEGLPASLDDLASGSTVRLEFSIDKKTVFGIDASAGKDELPGEVKSVDAANKSITLTVRVEGLRGDREVDLTFGLTADAKFRLAGKDVALTDLKPEMPARVAFAADRRTVRAVWAGPVPPKVEKKD